MGFKRVNVLLDLQSSLLNSIKKHLTELIDGLSTNRCVQVDNPKQNILECTTPWNSFVLIPKQLLSLKKRVFTISGSGLYSEPKPISFLSFKIGFPLDISTDDKYAIDRVKAGEYKDLYDAHADVYLGDIYTWEVDERLFLLVGGLSREYYLQSEFKYDNDFQPLVIRLIKYGDIETIDSFMKDFMERLFSQLSFIVSPIEEGEREEMNEEILDKKSIFSVYADYGWYASKLVEYNAKTLLKIKEILSPVNYPSYVINKLLENQDMESVKELIRAISRLNIILPCRFIHDCYDNLSFELIMKISLEHPLLLRKLVKHLRNIINLKSESHKNMVEFMERVYKEVKDIEETIGIPEIKNVILSELYGKMAASKDYLAAVMLLGRIFGIQLRYRDELNYIKNKIIVLFLELYMASKSNIVSNEIKRAILDELVATIKLVESKSKLFHHLYLHIRKAYPDFLITILKVIDEFYLSDEEYSLILRALYLTNKQDFINNLETLCKILSKDLINSIVELEYNRIIEQDLVYGMVNTNSIDSLIELSKYSKKAEDYLRKLVALMIDKGFLVNVLYLLERGYASLIDSEYKDKLLESLKGSCDYLEALFLLGKPNINLIEEVIDANIDKCQWQFYSLIDEVLKNEKSYDPKLIEYLKRIKSLLLIFMENNEITLEL